MKKKTNFDTVFWFILYLLPLFAFFVSYIHFGSAPGFFEYINQHFAFPFLSDLIDNIWLSAFDSACPLSGYISYIVLCDLMRCVFIVLAFIPRFCIRVCDKITNIKGGDSF